MRLLIFWFARLNDRNDRFIERAFLVSAVTELNGESHRFFTCLGCPGFALFIQNLLGADAKDDVKNHERHVIKRWLQKQSHVVDLKVLEGVTFSHGQTPYFAGIIAPPVLIVKRALAWEYAAPMKLYRHYKNKPYRYLGVAKHSETLEDLVLYETLYENDLGKLWVRPKAMFFEEIETGGKKRPRFEKVKLEISTKESVGAAEILKIEPIIHETFGEWDENWFLSTLRNHTKTFLTTAAIEGRTIGYKLGWEQDSWVFYSWLGGVLPDYQGVGIASALMRIQHEWCRQQGYHKIATKTQNRWREMLILNLKSGFEVVGTHESSSGGLKIMMEKDLRGSAEPRKPG
jgi:hypothetical protein